MADSVYLARKCLIMRANKVYPGEVHHVCQMTRGKVVIFYTKADYLVFFSIFCSLAEQMQIPVLALCPMPDHLHQVCIVRSREQLSCFVHEYSRRFARAWNLSRGRTGDLFHHSFRCSAKLDGKQVRTTLAYNYNNPVERRLVASAEQYPWNFLCYAQHAAPFSAPIRSDAISKAFRQVMQEARYCHDMRLPLNYAQLDRWSRRLSPGENQQLTDYLIGLWNSIDYSRAIGYYGSLEKMVRAFRDNTGSEYDIPEDRNAYSDAVYADCADILLRHHLVPSLRSIPTLPPEQKQALYDQLLHQTTARPAQLRKYLHLVDR